MSKRFSAVVVGASGFAGAELIRRLVMHPEVQLTRVGAIDHVGEPIASALPHLEGFTDLKFEDAPAAELAKDADILLMGLPHQASIDTVRALADTNVRILDLSGAFRLSDADAFKQFYGAAHAAPELLADFVYGLPEIHRDSIRGARRVASPGCFATSIELGLLPLARSGLLAGRVDTVAMTGSSGAGATATATTHHPVRAANLRSYKVLTHPHQPEVATVLREQGAKNLRLHFVPVGAPLTRGILATSIVEVSRDHSPAQVREAFHATYNGERFVRVPDQRLPEVVAVAGSNYAEAGVVIGDTPKSEATFPVTCVSALDNLLKGGAGQAIQNMNLMLGLEESLCLVDPGPYP